MSINEILDQLKATDDQLRKAGVDDVAKHRLKGLIIDLETELVMHSFDPLRDISAMTVVDVSKLPELRAELKAVIADEQRRTQLVTNITNIAKNALKAVGVALPI
ncbi:MAG TPA: hypothetical protein VKB12_09970 [Pyrinomonadaceae bacterium]|nr:hypothetical protein [Pyrinomonadaceae bacterium]